MKTLEIPISSSAPHFSQEHQIFDRHYNLEFEWIEREGYWILHLYDASEQPIALGLKILENWPLFKHEEIYFMLLQKNPTAVLNAKTLQSDFVLLAFK
jgi:hypothetical protein